MFNKPSIPRGFTGSRTSVFLFLVGFALFIVFIPPLFAGEYVLFVVETIFVFILVTLGLNILVGYLGDLAFASAGLLGIGAYASGLSIVRLGVNLFTGTLIGILFGILGGVVVGAFALRVTRYYLVIATLAFSEIMRWVYINVPDITFGSGGFTIQAQSLFDIKISGIYKYYFCAILTVLALLFTKLLLSSRYGRAFVAIRENKYAAQASGISVGRMKMIAYMWSGALTGLAGALIVLVNQFVDPNSYNMSQVLTHFSMVMIGGIGSFIGSIVGATLLAALPALLSSFPGLQEIIVSILLIAIILRLPAGLIGLVERKWPVLRERRRHG